MPIYAYRCESCGFAKDVLQKMSDDPLSVCPECQKTSFKKQVTAAGFQLKGSGWYVTDFRGADKASSGASGAQAAASSETNSGTNSGTNTSSNSEAPSTASNPGSTSSSTSESSASPTKTSSNDNKAA